MAFQRDFNDLLTEVLTSYKAQFPGAVTPGTVLFIKASCTAAMLWGLYQQLDRVSDQMFVASADRAHKERHAAEFGIATADKTDAQIVDEVLAAKRSKLAGGNRYDYIAWAKEAVGAENLADVIVVPLAQGEGTFDIVVANKDIYGAMPPSDLQRIRDYIQARRPIGSGFSWGTRIIDAQPEMVEIAITGHGVNWNIDGTKSALRAYVEGLGIGRTVARSMLYAIAHEYGADTVSVVRPTADVVPHWNPAAGEYGVAVVRGVISVEVE